MGHDSDDLVSLPAAPPPNPAARRAGIDAALRKFDGIEDATPARQSPWQWASSHRRATGGLVTAALIAVVGIPAIQVALRNPPQESASEQAAPGVPTTDVESLADNVAIEVAPPRAEPAEPVPVARSEQLESKLEVAAPEEERIAFADSTAPQKARVAPVAPAINVPVASVAAAPPPSAPPPPPPPPPAPAAQMAEREAADEVAAQSGSVVVTGSRTRRANLESASPVAVVTADDAYAGFQAKLQSAFRTNRQAILGLVGFPLRVDFNGDVRTYRNRSDVERDFDRIFTADVRASVLGGQEGRHLTVSRSGSTTKIRAVRP